MFGGFASTELQKRIDAATPKLIVAASCGLEPNKVIDYKALLDSALAQCKPAVVQGLKVVIVQREKLPVAADKWVAGRDVNWDDVRSDRGGSEGNRAYLSRVAL